MLRGLVVYRIAVHGGDTVAMSTSLVAIEEALAGLTDAELLALKLASNEAPQVAAGLLAWIKGLAIGSSTVDTGSTTRFSHLRRRLIRARMPYRRDVCSAIGLCRR